MESRSSQPFLLRLAAGDIIDAEASMIVVGHINDVAAGGAEAAVDAVLGGALARHIGPRRSKLGTTHLLPTLTSPLASPCVAVVSLGDAEEIELKRLPELGAAVVEAAATVGAPDVATVVLGGSMGIGRVGAAATALVTGALDAVVRRPRADRLRELTIVERDANRLKEIRETLHSLRHDLTLHIYTAELEVRRTLTAHDPPPPEVEQHLRIGVTRSGEQLKVTRIGHEAFDMAKLFPFPNDVAKNIVQNLREQVLKESEAGQRKKSLASIGIQLFNAFLGEAGIKAEDFLTRNPGDYVVFRLDDSTVDLPWELLTVDDSHVVLDKRFARQVELSTPGRQSAFVPDHERLSVLVIGNPTGDLPAAQTEAKAVADSLKKSGADVQPLIGEEATYRNVSEALDTVCYDVVHYAGHAKFDVLREDAGGLVLRDQILTAQDLASRHYLPRLLVANACYSGTTGDVRLQPASDNDAEIRRGTASQATRNLVTGVLAAGARGFVGAAWEIDDEAAATFAEAFYAELLVDEVGRGTLGEAMRRGRRAVVACHGFEQPAWAAYVLYGSPWKRAWERKAIGS